jgi:hypothetical protein
MSSVAVDMEKLPGHGGFSYYCAVMFIAQGPPLPLPLLVARQSSRSPRFITPKIEALLPYRPAKPPHGFKCMILAGPLNNPPFAACAINCW